RLRQSECDAVAHGTRVAADLDYEMTLVRRICTPRACVVELDTKHIVAVCGHCSERRLVVDRDVSRAVAIAAAVPLKLHVQAVFSIGLREVVALFEPNRERRQVCRRAVRGAGPDDREARGRAVLDGGSGQPTTDVCDRIIASPGDALILADRSTRRVAEHILAAKRLVHPDIPDRQLLATIRCEQDATD